MTDLSLHSHNKTISSCIFTQPHDFRVISTIYQVTLPGHRQQIILMQDFHWNWFDGKSPHSLNDFFQGVESLLQKIFLLKECTVSPKTSI